MAAILNNHENVNLV